DMAHVLQMMNNEAGDQKLDDQRFKDTFELWWPKLEEQVSAALSAAPQERAPKRDSEEVLDEILSLVREMARDRDRDLDMIEKLQNVTGLVLDIVRKLKDSPLPGLTLGQANPSGHIGPVSGSFVTDQTPGTILPPGPEYVRTKT